MEKKRKIIVISVIGLIIIIIIFFLFYKSKYKEDVPSTGKTNYDISSCISSVTDNTTSYLNNISYNASGDESTLNPYKIIIKNNCTTYITYNITFKINENNYDLNTLFYDIYDKDYKLDNRHALNTMQNNILFSGELNSKESKILLLYIWSTSEINGQNIKGEISVNPDKTMEAAPHYWYSSKDGSLISSIKNNYKITLPKTTPGKEISTVTEKELSRTTDSEGISYYFRGNVDNNYVLFANKCWQIVRITGSGSIKLILYNDNYYNAPNPCNFGLDESNAAFAKYNKDVFQSTYNAKTNDNAYVGFMYGDVNSKSYLKTRQNSNKSIIMKNLENWYENNLVHYEKYLADNISCVDKTIDKNSVENINFTNLGYNNNNTWYMGSDRVINNEPTLECSNNNLISNKKNGIYKIGLITTDEVLFAGGSYENRNINYYLYNNANGNNWWTLTPAKYDNGAYVWRVGASGGLYYSLVNNSYAVRPVISLKSVIMVSGKGTTSNPYKVEE